MRAGRTLMKLAVAGGFRATGALTLMAGVRRALGGPRVHLLGFHRVVDDLARIGPDVIPALCVTTASFRRICELARRECEVLSLADAVAVLDGRRTARRDVVSFTFDDGYRDVYRHALPVLRELGLPATVFVPTGHVDTDEPLLHDRLFSSINRARLGRRELRLARVTRSLRPTLERVAARVQRGGVVAAAGMVDELLATLPMQALQGLAASLEELLGERARPDGGGLVMSAEELRACVEGGFELGAHTVEHVVLTREPPARVRRELQRPRRVLEDISGRPCTSFAYCNGLWNRALVEELRASGYTIAVTTTDRPNEPGADPLLLGRKVLWEGHARGLLGRYSPSLAAAHLHDLFGTLAHAGTLGGLLGSVTRHEPVREGGVHGEEARPWRRLA